MPSTGRYPWDSRWCPSLLSCSSLWISPTTTAYPGLTSPTSCFIPSARTPPSLPCWAAIAAARYCPARQIRCGESLWSSVPGLGSQLHHRHRQGRDIQDLHLHQPGRLREQSFRRSHQRPAGPGRQGPARGRATRCSAGMRRGDMSCAWPGTRAPTIRPRPAPAPTWPRSAWPAGPRTTRASPMPWTQERPSSSACSGSEPWG